jgi:plasmid stabilization system protein ParE
MRIIWTEQTLRELEAIGDYIARDNQRAAVTVVTRILDLVDLLGEQSEIGRPGRIAGTRELVSRIRRLSCRIALVKIASKSCRCSTARGSGQRASTDRTSIQKKKGRRIAAAA